MLYGREMRLPTDTVLQPKDHLPQAARVYLSRILQNLEVCRKLAGENIKAAQGKYKHYYAKITKVPDYHPAQRVWPKCANGEGIKAAPEKGWTLLYHNVRSKSYLQTVQC